MSHKNPSSLLKTGNLFLAISWIYQGLVPKILFPDTGELKILQTINFFQGLEREALLLIGLSEILFGICFLIFPKREIHLINISSLILLTLTAAYFLPNLFTLPFNPFSLNLSMIGISVLILIAKPNIFSISKEKD